MDDYIRMQHPKYRRKKYLKEAWWNAVDLLFDKETRLQKIKNNYGEDMSLQELVRVASDRENINIKQLQEHVLKESLSFWNTKPINTVDIPDSIVVEGHAYYIRFDIETEQDSYVIDYNKRLIILSKPEDSSEAEEEFVAAVFEVMCYHTESRVSKATRTELSGALFRTLRINNCFTGD